jgi:hypothetical protein
VLARPLERASGATSYIEALDRLIDKGIVIDAWMRVSVGGIDLITIEAKVVVASIDTYGRLAHMIEAPARPPIQLVRGRRS